MDPDQFLATYRVAHGGDVFGGNEAKVLDGLVHLSRLLNHAPYVWFIEWAATVLAPMGCEEQHKM